MRIYDPLYGSFVVSRNLGALILTPEVRRLSQIRLLNALSPSVAALGELRRYSHTLGVLYLAQKNQSPGYSKHERQALAASVLLHDIGTPPFGHLFEYHLREQKGWSHEGIIRAVLWGLHAPENRAHQIFAGRSIEFRQALKRSGVSVELVEQIVTGKHPLSLLLFGTLDLDNLDNVARMSWALGLPSGSQCAAWLASALWVGRDFSLRLPVSIGRDAIRQWSSLRRSVYDIIVFDPPTVAAQAVLSEAISRAMAIGVLGEDDWSLTDEALLELLRSTPNTKDLVMREYLGQLPEMVFSIQIEGGLKELGLSGRASAKALVEEILRSESSEDRALGYVFLDKGTFEKKLRFLDPNTGESWDEGESSGSVVFYGFLPVQRRAKAALSERTARKLLERLSVSPARVTRCITATPPDTEDAQFTFDSTTS